jgi:hypothetical protein
LKNYKYKKTVEIDEYKGVLTSWAKGTLINYVRTTRELLTFKERKKDNAKNKT